MKAIITVGLGFGDEGKGATVDFLCRLHQAEWVVRYCGGSQCGHNVHLPDGRHHMFAQFGAGSLAGVPTYLGPEVIIYPNAMWLEYTHLLQLGFEPKLVIDPNCLVSTVYHRRMNRLKELYRCENRHGSCGHGIGETRQCAIRHFADSIRAKDLINLKVLREKMSALHERYCKEASFGYENEDISQLNPLDEAANLLETTRKLTEQDSVSVGIPKFNGALVFEGAQGVLLDEWVGFHPHTTWSTVTLKHALEITKLHGISDTEVVGVTRSYSTRHGAGPFPSETNSGEEADNMENKWQGKFRSGPLDLHLLRYAASALELPVDYFALNHLDKGDTFYVCFRYEDSYNVPLMRAGKFFDLEHQEAVGKRLAKCQPIVSKLTKGELIRHLSQYAPVRIKGYGKTWLNRLTT